MSITAYKKKDGDEVVSQPTVTTYKKYAPGFNVRLVNTEDTTEKTVSQPKNNTDVQPVQQNVVPSAAKTDNALAQMASAKSFSYNGTKPTYASPYSAQIDRLFDEIQNNPDFSYDPETDESYIALKGQYTNLGRQAMKDTSAQVAAQTGGIASSYAVSAGAQAYNQYMNELSGYIPELQQLAYEMYQNDLNQKYQQLDALNALENQEYNKYRDELSDYYTDYNNAYNQFLNEQSQQNYLNELLYQQQQDALSRQDYLNELEYSRAMDEWERQRYQTEWEYQLQQDAIDQQNYENEFEYQKYLNDLEQQNYLNEFEYQRQQDALSQQNYENELSYQQYLNGLEQNNYEREFAYQQEQDELDRAWNEALTRAEFGDMSGLTSLGVDISNYGTSTSGTDDDDDFDPYSKETIGIIANDILYDRDDNTGALPTAGLLPQTISPVSTSVVSSVLGIPESDLVVGTQRTYNSAMQKADEALRSGAIDTYQYELLMKQLNAVYDNQTSRMLK